MYILNVESGIHNVDNTIHNVAHPKKEKIQNIAGDIMNGNIMNGNIVDAPRFCPRFSIFFKALFHCPTKHTWRAYKSEHPPVKWNNLLQCTQ